MKNKTIIQWCAVVCAVELGMAAAEQTNVLPSGATNLPDYFTYAAERTYAAYGAAITAGKEEKPAADAPVIPSKYWTEPIKALRPIRVYLHHHNLVVVQKVSDNVEEGKYIMNSISSYLPKSGDNGFSFSPSPKSATGGLSYPANGVLEFKRTAGGGNSSGSSGAKQ
jgi:hypothetical protein